METDRRPWKVRLEYRGQSKRTGGWSEKWWSLSGNGSGSVEVNHGKIGSNGRSNPFVFDLTKGIETMHKKLDDGYCKVTGSMEDLPPLTATSTHADLPGIYRDIRYIESDVPGSYIACNEQGEEVCRLTQKGAAKLVALSTLIHARTEQCILNNILN
jgi:hypothetical protein